MGQTIKKSLRLPALLRVRVAQETAEARRTGSNPGFSWLFTNQKKIYIYISNMDRYGNMVINNEHK
jgi:hypothetical protein